MLLSTLAKCCIGVFTTGVAVAVPVLVTTKPWSSTTSQVASEGQTHSGAPASAARSAGLSLHPDQLTEAETKFNDCMTQHLESFSARNKQTGQTVIVPRAEVESYLLKKNEWDVDVFYKGECGTKAKQET